MNTELTICYRSTIQNDSDCTRCGARARRLECDDCGVSAMIVDCGCMSQPRPIATEGHHVYCETCADERAASRAACGV